MSSTPLLSVKNRFAVLLVDEVYESNSISSTDLSASDVQAVLPPPSPRSCFRKRPNWEKRLPNHYVVATTPSALSFKLKVSLQTTDTSAIHTTKALLDCGATDLFVNPDFVARNHLTTKTLSRPIPVYNVDGSPNEAGDILEVVDVLLRFRDHSERATFAVTGIGNQDVILSLTWLHEHNPEVDWQTNEVKMS